MAGNYGPPNERLNEASSGSTSTLIDCPYDPTHRVSPSKIQTHLKKCMEQHKDSGFVICPYNFTHHYPEEQRDEHMKTCDGQDKAMQSMMERRDTTPQLPALPSIEHLPTEESWDDCDFPTYDPMQANKDKVLLVPLKGVCKSERKQYREERRKKNSQIMVRELLEKKNELEKKKKEHGDDYDQNV